MRLSKGGTRGSGGRWGWGLHFPEGKNSGAQKDEMNSPKSHGE